MKAFLESEKDEREKVVYSEKGLPKYPLNSNSIPFFLLKAQDLNSIFLPPPNHKLRIEIQSKNGRKIR